MLMETPSRNVFYKDDDFVIETEEYEDAVLGRVLLLHCTVSYWKLSALRRGYSVFADLQDWAEDNKYECLMTVTPNPRFAKLMGGTTLRYLHHDNENYEVIVWELRKQH